ncbi:UNVERIFIED_CONTAM: hypothetical protein DV033_10480 [Limosilactobacillus fermentum]|uniref:Capsular polysaccharide synthesis protein n=1 Tax=Limosilactobacillus fermentum TaxID=1613 RepID=A0AAJ5ZUY9_LIMFE|nr:capsular polysaccharide synthesis protein [Limosilactobacillus fermentum]MCV3756150.1 capsular polysaccharide synthesis protein [Limosilactobacillus fermentum]MED7636085.1 hypothetical protein [Limosilactobacillus fermentum]WFR89292.1 capsular polysaccharide synthesis protein [Limosilactobacillus fermentum]
MTMGTMYQRLKLAKANHYLYAALKGWVNKKVIKNVCKVRKIDSNYVKQANENFQTHRLLRKQYQGTIDDFEKKDGREESFEKIVWWCWLQGVEKAPEIVKVCLESVRRQFKGYKINIVTADNLEEYIEIPEYIKIKYKAGIIPNANFSDIIRVMLLSKYGGVWIDSTVYCSNGLILPVIEKEDLFMFKNDVLSGNEDIKMSSWFISARKNNYVITTTKKLMLKYWRTHDYLIDYFLFHIFMSMILNSHPEEWDKIPTFDNVSPHIMSKELNAPYSRVRYQQLNSFSSVHKLSHHAEFDSYHDTLYKHLVENDL